MRRIRSGSRHHCRKAGMVCGCRDPQGLPQPRALGAHCQPGTGIDPFPDWNYRLSVEARPPQNNDCGPVLPGPQPLGVRRDEPGMSFCHKKVKAASCLWLMRIMLCLGLVYQLAKQQFRRLQIRRVESLGKPAIDPGQ